MKRLLTTTLMLSCLSLPLMAEAHHFDEQHFVVAAGSGESFLGEAFIGGPLEQNRQHWKLAREQTYISRAQAIDIARHRTNGKILSAHLVQKNQHAFYKIKVLTDQGRIKVLRINAQSGHR